MKSVHDEAQFEAGLSETHMSIIDVIKCKCIQTYESGQNGSGLTVNTISKAKTS